MRERIGGGPTTMLRWEEFKQTLKVRVPLRDVGPIPERSGDLQDTIRELQVENLLLQQGKPNERPEMWISGLYARTSRTKRTRAIPANGKVSNYDRLEQQSMYKRSVSATPKPLSPMKALVRDNERAIEALKAALVAAQRAAK